MTTGITSAPEAPPPRILTGWGWVTLTPMAVYSNAKGELEALPLEALTEALLAAEALHTEDRLDGGGTTHECSVPSGTEAEVVKTKEVEVPAGEVWFVERLALTTEPEVLGNIRISKFPKVNDTEKALLTSYQAEPSGGHSTYLVNYDLADPSLLGAPLRLLGGARIIVVGKVHASGATTADRKVSLNIYGRKARRIAP